MPDILTGGLGPGLRPGLGGQWGTRGIPCLMSRISAIGGGWVGMYSAV